MSKRINISLPDTLAERLERFKPRLNVSEVCATALEKEIRMLETVTVETRALQEVVGRLRAQRKRISDKSREAGFKEGARWALEKGDYAELKWFADHEASEPSWADLMSSQQEGLWEEILNDVQMGGWEPPYVNGFAEGMLDVWNRIKEAVESD